MELFITQKQQKHLARKYPNLTTEQAFNQAIAEALREPDFVDRALRAETRRKVIRFVGLFLLALIAGFIWLEIKSN